MTTVIAGVYKQSGLPDEIIPVKVTADGTLAGGSGGGGSGTSDTTEATQLQVLAKVTSMDTKLPSQVLSSVPVVASARNCTGRQVLSISTSVGLSPVGGGITAMIQADGGTIRVSLDGTAATATSGIRLDDGVMLFIDSNLSNVRLFASVATNVQVAYFDRP